MGVAQGSVLVLTLFSVFINIRVDLLHLTAVLNAGKVSFLPIIVVGNPLSQRRVAFIGALAIQNACAWISIWCGDAVALPTSGWLDGGCSWPKSKGTKIIGEQTLPQPSCGFGTSWVVDWVVGTILHHQFHHSGPNTGSWTLVLWVKIKLQHSWDYAEYSWQILQNTTDFCT